MREGRSESGGEMPSHDLEARSYPDSAVAGARSWLIRAALVASTAALLGTSDDSPPRFQDQFVKTVEMPMLELTSESPSSRFLVTVTAQDLGPELQVTTSNASAQMVGNVGGTSATGEVPTLLIKLNDLPPIDATDNFFLSQGLGFSGNCEDPQQMPFCSASFLVTLSRSDNGERGGILRVSWNLELSSEVSNTGDADRGPFEAPWVVDMVLQ